MITPKFVNVKAVTIHPRYDGYIHHGYDISILELDEELDLDTYTPACLAKSDDNTTTSLVGKMATIAGWGNDPWPDPWVPSEVAVPVKDAADCAGNPVTVASILDTGHEGLGMGVMGVMTYF